jgi:hypothetical protein
LFGVLLGRLKAIRNRRFAAVLPPSRATTGESNAFAGLALSIKRLPYGKARVNGIFPGSPPRGKAVL